MALANQRQVEEFAIRMTECADAIHARLMKAIKNKEIEQPDAQALFQEEIVLRQRANSLYMFAANCVVEGIAESQKNILDLVDAAQAKIRAITKIAGFIDFVADILVLAAAAYAAKPELILAALKEVKKDLDPKGVRSLNPPAR